MGSTDPLELDVLLDEPSIENESVVLNGAKQRRPLLALCVVALLGFIGWQLFTGGETNGDSAVTPETADSTPDDGDSAASEIADEGVPPVDGDTDQPSPVVTVEPPTTEYKAIEEPLEIEGDETAIGGIPDATDSAAEPVFPLFPDRPGLTVAIANQDGRIVLLNADDGATTILSSSTSVRSGNLRDQSSQLGRIGDTLVTLSGPTVLGFPLDGSPKIDFGSADGFALTGGMVVLQRWADGPDDVAEFRAFQPDGRGDNGWVDAPNNNIWMRADGFISAAGGTYRFSGDGFERVSAHDIVAVGENHLVEHRCDAALDCSYYRVDVRTGRAEVVVVERDLSWNRRRISPDGKWITFFWWGLGDPSMAIASLETGEDFLLPDPSGFNGDEPSPPSWDNSSRYAVSATSDGRGLVIFDAETFQYREVLRGALGLDVGLSQVVVLDLADL